MSYGHKIAEHRKAKSLTQAELGEKLNITAQAVSKWENNLSEPDLDSIKRLCEIFEISVDEFLGVSTAKKEVVATETVTKHDELKEPAQANTLPPQPAILGYCSKCKKPLYFGDAVMEKMVYDEKALFSKVQETTTPRVYCRKCQAELKLQLKKQKAIYEIQEKKASYKKSLIKGLIWGGVVFALSFILLLIVYFSQTKADPKLPFYGTFVTPLLLFAIISPFFWDNFVSDMLDFFRRSFSAPFGLIFELSLDGFLWFITVKLALWVIFTIFEILFFIFGLAFTSLVALVGFPFFLVRQILKAKGNF